MWGSTWESIQWTKTGRRGNSTVGSARVVYESDQKAAAHVARGREMLLWADAARAAE